MKRLSRSDIDKAVRMRLSGASMANIAHALGVSYKTLRKALARHILASAVRDTSSSDDNDSTMPRNWFLRNGELEPPASELVHVGADSPDYPGFNLLPDDAARLHEVRQQNGWYGLHPDFFPAKNY